MNAQIHASAGWVSTDPKRSKASLNAAAAARALRWAFGIWSNPANQLGRHASSLPKTQQLPTQGFVRDFGSR
jgi:hypothetical protein